MDASSLLPKHNEKIIFRKQRNKRLKKSDAELIQLFWSAPNEAFFGQETVATVTSGSIKTLECNRWRGKGIPYRKCAGRVLYRKSDVIAWLESHELVSSTSEYQKEGIMSNPEEESRQPSERLCGCESSIESNDNSFLSQIHYKNFILQLPPVVMDKDSQYQFMKEQVGYLPRLEYDAAIRFICDVLDY